MPTIRVELLETDRRLAFLKMRARRCGWSLASEIRCILAEYQLRAETDTGDHLAKERGRGHA
jgi:plasmid stability protein